MTFITYLTIAIRYLTHSIAPTSEGGNGAGRAGTAPPRLPGREPSGAGAGAAAAAAAFFFFCFLARVGLAGRVSETMPGRSSPRLLSCICVLVDRALSCCSEVAASNGVLPSRKELWNELHSESELFGASKGGDLMVNVYNEAE